MSRPDPTSFTQIAASSGHDLDATRIEAIASACDAAWPGVLAMRAVPLDLIGAIEPAHLVGRLASRSRRS